MKKLEIVKFLVNFTDLPNVPNNFGITAIHLAALHGFLDIVKFLVEFTNSPNVPDNNGFTALDYAIWNQHDEVSQFLKKYPEINTHSFIYFCVILATLSFLVRSHCRLKFTLCHFSHFVIPS